MICPHCGKAIPAEARSIVAYLRKEISIRGDSTFRARDFLTPGFTKLEIANNLNYLFRTGELIRVARGLYKRGSLL